MILGNDLQNGSPCRGNLTTDRGRAMTEIRNWQVIESQVYWPESWFFGLVGVIFLSLGTFGLLAGIGSAPPEIPGWMPKAFWATFALLGAIPLTQLLTRKVRPVRVRHAMLPDVPSEPVLLEDSIVSDHWTYELIEEPEGWQFCPNRLQLRKIRCFLLGFGIPFLILFAAILSWGLHRENLLPDWPLAILCGTSITAFTGGTAFLIIGLLFRMEFRKCCSLNISRNGGELELQVPRTIDLASLNLEGELNWPLSEDDGYRRLQIPREAVVAVQLCPWKVAIKSKHEWTTTWAVQGILVLRPAAEEHYRRVPILLTSDFFGVPGHLAQLAEVLQVPFLFHADKPGWNAELARAWHRPPLKSGGFL